MSIDFGKRILIAIPHPDDEIVGFCAAIGRARAKGSVVFGQYLTNGCIARETLWPWQRKSYDRNVLRRLQESVEVARHLQINPISFSDRPARHLWRSLPCIAQELARSIEEHGIDQLWVPAYEGGNADHDALNAVGSLLRERVSVLEFAEYNFLDATAQAQTFPKPDGTETIIELTETERSFKNRMLACYQSEQKNLGYVGTQKETYRPLANYDYTRPAHHGTLWYTRFHWVPFRHPRIDFTKPEDVSAAIAALNDTKPTEGCQQR